MTTAVWNHVKAHPVAYGLTALYSVVFAIGITVQYWLMRTASSHGMASLVQELCK